MSRVRIPSPALDLTPYPVRASCPTGPSQGESQNTPFLDNLGPNWIQNWIQTTRSILRPLLFQPRVSSFQTTAEHMTPHEGGTHLLADFPLHHESCDQQHDPDGMATQGNKTVGRRCRAMAYGSSAKPWPMDRARNPPPPLEGVLWRLAFLGREGGSKPNEIPNKKLPIFHKVIQRA